MFKMYGNILSSWDKEEGDTVVIYEGVFPWLFSPVILPPPSGEMRQNGTSKTVLGSDGSSLTHSLNPLCTHFGAADHRPGTELGTGRSSQSRDRMDRPQSAPKGHSVLWEWREGDTDKCTGSGREGGDWHGPQVSVG